MENLFEQMTNITKAHGYDILSKQVGELKSERDALEAKVKELKNALSNFTDSVDIIVQGLEDGEKRNTYLSIQNSLTYKTAKEALKK